MINDVGLTLDMLAPLSGGMYALTAALGAACKSICGMVAGATRASITAHFAMRGNLADVSAKENAQETAVNLAGLLLGSLVASSLGDSPPMAWAAFVALTLLHVWANAVGVGCLTFDFLNAQRAHILTRAWVAQAASITPADISAAEAFWRPLQLWLHGPRFGVGIQALVGEVDETPNGAEATLRALDALFASEQCVSSTALVARVLAHALFANAHPLVQVHPPC